MADNSDLSISVSLHGSLPALQGSRSTSSDMSDRKYVEVSCWTVNFGLYGLSMGAKTFRRRLLHLSTLTLSQQDATLMTITATTTERVFIFANARNYSN